MKTTVSIIGYGRLGQLLHKTLQKSGYDNISILRKGDDILLLNEYVFIAVPDGNVSEVIQEIGDSGLNLDGKMITHCSGVLGLDVFDDLKSKKVKIGCVHPLMAITESSESFDGITFDVCGDDTFISNITPLIQDLGAEVLVVDEHEKAKLHLAAVITSNYQVTLMAMALEVFSNDEFDQEQLKKALLPLMSSTLQNLGSQSPEDALTGPIFRGDIETIRRHLDLFHDQPELKSLYKKLGTETMRLLGRSLSVDVKSKLIDLFDEA